MNDEIIQKIALTLKEKEYKDKVSKAYEKEASLKQTLFKFLKKRPTRSSKTLWDEFVENDYIKNLNKNEKELVKLVNKYPDNFLKKMEKKAVSEALIAKALSRRLSNLQTLKNKDLKYLFSKKLHNKDFQALLDKTTKQLFYINKSTPLAKAAELSKKEKRRRYAINNALAGGAAGVASVLATEPLDTIQTKAKTTGDPISKIIKETYKKGKGGIKGVRGVVKGMKPFYAGMGTKILKVVPATAITFSAFQALSHLLNRN